MVSLPDLYFRFTFFNLRRMLMNKSFIIKIIVLCLVTIKVYAIEKVVLFGDSLMAGYGLSNEYHLSVVLKESLISDGLNIEVINGSVSGSTSSGGLNRAEWTLSEVDIDLMILGLGANDMLRGINPKETKKNFDKIYPDLSKKYKLTLIPFLLEGVALKPKYNLSDGMHPNEKGTIIISKTLQEIILKNILPN